MNSEVTVPISRITENVVMRVKVTGMRSWTIRMRVAMWLMRLASAVSGLGLEIETEATR